jgi:hypothetical protein
MSFALTESWSSVTIRTTLRGFGVGVGAGRLVEGVVGDDIPDPQAADNSSEIPRNPLRRVIQSGSCV